MNLIPFILALASSVIAMEGDIVFPLNAKLENGQPDPRAGMRIHSSAYYNNESHVNDTLIGKTDGEVYGFGKSYHTNRNVNWNESNFGLAGGIAYHLDHATDIIGVAGSYKDSFDETATFALGGVRWIAGERRGAHATIGVSGGYFKGSGFRGIGFLPVASIGYDWLDLCVTGTPPGVTGSNSSNGSRAPRQNRDTLTGFIGVFVKIRLATF